MNGHHDCQPSGNGARGLGNGMDHGAGRHRQSRAVLAAASLAIALTGCGSASVSPSAEATASQSAAPAATMQPTATATPHPTAQVMHGVFHPAATMAGDARAVTTTLLLDGRVLVGEVKGDGDPLVSPAELYDPARNAFVHTGSLAGGRDGYAAVRLLDGRVLVAGGGDVTGPLKSAELYDPATGKFSPTGSMITARYDFSATLLLDGHVLITGGLYIPTGANGTYPLAAAELYDPASGKFSPTGSMVVARHGHTATLLADGRVLIAGGGFDKDFQPYASAELYDPRTGKFRATGSMSAARESHTATLLPDGRVLIAGGSGRTPAAAGGGPGLSSAELFDPQRGTFSATGPLATPRSSHSATLLKDGRVLVAGGQPNVTPGSPGASVGPVTLATAELYDPATGNFSPTGSMFSGHPAPLATLLLDGRVLIIDNSDAEIYTP